MASSGSVDRSLAHAVAHTRVAHLPVLPVTSLSSGYGSAAPVTVIASDSLLKGAREIEIRHGNQTYRLRHTRNDKLILTK